MMKRLTLADECACNLYGAQTCIYAVDWTVSNVIQATDLCICSCFRVSGPVRTLQTAIPDVIKVLELLSLKC